MKVNQILRRPYHAPQIKVVSFQIESGFVGSTGSGGHAPVELSLYLDDQGGSQSAIPQYGYQEWSW